MKRITILGLFLFFFFVIIKLNATSYPQIHAESAIAVDVDKQEIIFAKDIDSIIFPASITKLITAVLLARNRKKDDILIYSAKAKTSYPYKLDLTVNTKVKASDAMDALLLFSANDIAYMIAENLSGTKIKFSVSMNNLATEFNLEKTHFTNPSGLHEINHYTSAFDLSRLAREIYNYPWILESLGKNKHTINISDTEKITFQNRNKLLGKDGCIGGKTGWTPEAGRCLLSLYERNGRRIVGVVIHSIYDKEDKKVFEDMENLINYSYKVKKIKIINAGSIAKFIPVYFKAFHFFGPVKKRNIPLIIKDTILGYPYSEPIHVSFRIENINPYKLKRTKSLGILNVKTKENNMKYRLYPDFSVNDFLRIDILPFYLAILSLIITGFFSVLVFIIIVKINRTK